MARRGVRGTQRCAIWRPLACDLGLETWMSGRFRLRMSKFSRPVPHLRLPQAWPHQLPAAHGGAEAGTLNAHLETVENPYVYK